MDWKFLFFSPDGRISRQQFWIGVLILLGAGMVLSWIPLINVIAGLVSIYVWVCLYAKRLHDFGRSGWLTAVPIGLFVLACILGVATMGGMAAAGAFTGMHGGDYAAHPGAMVGMGLTALLFMLVGLVALGFLLWVGLTPGEPGPNRYGDPPAPTPLPSPKADAPQG